jgi:hypothetical protein
MELLQMPYPNRDLLRCSPRYNDERRSQVDSSVEQCLQRSNRKDRVDVAGSKEYHAYDRLKRGNRECPKIGTDKTTSSHVENIATSPAKIGDDVPMDVLIRENGKLVELQGRTSAEIKTSFSRKWAA